MILFAFIISCSLCYAASVALIDQALGAAHGGGFVELALSTRNLSHDLYGTHPDAASLQTMYNNISQYSLIIFAPNAGKNSTINSIVSNSTNQQILRDYLYNGGNIFMNVYDDGGNGANFLNLPGIGFSGLDNPDNPYTLVNDDPIFHSSFEVLYQVSRINAWEAITAFPTAATETKVHLASGSYYAAASFKWGAGRVFFTSQPIDSNYPTSTWYGLEDIYGTTVAMNFVENIYHTMSYNVAVPEMSSLFSYILCLGLILYKKMRS